ncbi:MAG: surface-adhesin E family protein [Gammaproteobacteria bacterium]
MRVSALVAGLLFVWAGAVDAAPPHWWWVDGSGSPQIKFLVFIDVDSIQQVGEFRHAWALTVFRTNPPRTDRVYTTKSLEQYDCQNRKVGTLYWQANDVNGDVIPGQTSAYPTMEYVAPDTVSSAKMDFVCSESSSRPSLATDLNGLDPEAAAKSMMGEAQAPPITPQTPPRPRSRKNVPRVYHPNGQ